MPLTRVNPYRATGKQAQQLAASVGLTVLYPPKEAKYQQGIHKRFRLWIEHKGRCHWCGCLTEFDLSPNGQLHAKTATIDHIVSRGMGRPSGTNGSLVLSCHEHNAARNNLEQKLKAGKRVPLEWCRLFMNGMDGDGI